jgi:F-type H+-transporting ATPase subunit b
MRRAAQEADAERQRLLGEARKAADELSAKRQDMLQKDFHKLRESVRLRTQQEVFAIARKALRDLGAAELEAHIAGVFIRRLRDLGGAAKKVLADAVETSREPIVLRSAYELSEEQRSAIQKAVREVFPTDLSIRFMTEPNLIGGIELAVNGQKIAWSISDYLDSMEEDIARLIREKGGSKTGAAETEAAGAGKGAD